MARIRSIKPDFWTDEKVVELSAFARLLFIGLWNFADEEGRMEYSARRIKMQILPADDTDVSVLISAIQCVGLIDIYTVEGKEYLQIVNFEKHQKLDPRLKSKLPPNTDSHRFAPPEKEKEKEKEKERESNKKFSKLDDVTVEENSHWLEKKRSDGKYLKHNPEHVLEVFRNYCLSKGKKYADYMAAYRNAFDWDRCQPENKPEKGGQGAGRITL